jgi:ABC-type uncharacterized transport system permease subunit
VTFREAVAGALILFFAWAFYMNPHDQAIIGALLTSFATAYGFYLGGSKVGSDTATKNAETVAASAASSLAGPTDVTVVNPPDAPVPTTDGTDAAAVAQSFKDQS